MKHMTKPKTKCSFFNQEIKKASNVMVEEDFLKINYKKAKIVDSFF